jgi:hypothetical protein
MTIRIFIGCAANHEDAESQAVLEYSIRRFASQPIEIVWMKLSNDPDSPFYSGKAGGWKTIQWATPFSGFRWAIPALCGFKGRAIYMDSDVIVMDDINELWRQRFTPGKVVMAKGSAASWRYCVSLWNCERAQGVIWPFETLREKPESHKMMCRYFAHHPALVQSFRGNWNCLDGESYADLADPDIKAIHYTSMKHQPQLKHAVPRLAAQGRRHWFDGEPADHPRRDLSDLFDRTLIEAEAAGFTVDRYTADPMFGEYQKLNVGEQGKRIPNWIKPAA